MEHLRTRLRAHGAKPCHEEHVLRLVGAGAAARTTATVVRRTFSRSELRNALPALLTEFQALARLRSEHPGEDGSARLLVELADGQTVESVLLPRDGAVRLDPGRAARWAACSA